MITPAADGCKHVLGSTSLSFRDQTLDSRNNGIRFDDLAQPPRRKYDRDIGVLSKHLLHVCLDADYFPGLGGVKAVSHAKHEGLRAANRKRTTL